MKRAKTQTWVTIGGHSKLIELPSGPRYEDFIDVRLSQATTVLFQMPDGHALRITTPRAKYRET